jgi:hypothetical protein
MRSYNIKDDKKFARMFWRDFWVCVAVGAVSAIGIILVLKYSIQYGW